MGWEGVEHADWPGQQVREGEGAAEERAAAEKWRAGAGWSWSEKVIGCGEAAVPTHQLPIWALGRHPLCVSVCTK